MECATVLVFGWTIQYRIHISVPIICSFFIGWAVTCIYSIVNTYLVDVFTHSGASATAALNLARCLFGAGGTAAILPLANAISIGWAFTLFTALMLVCLGLLWVQMQFGGRWRRKREERREEAENS